jgi:hypothetical protein
MNSALDDVGPSIPLDQLHVRRHPRRRIRGLLRRGPQLLRRLPRVLQDLDAVAALQIFHDFGQALRRALALQTRLHVAARLLERALLLVAYFLHARHMKSLRRLEDLTQLVLLQGEHHVVESRVVPQPRYGLSAAHPSRQQPTGILDVGIRGEFLAKLVELLALSDHLAHSLRDLAVLRHEDADPHHSLGAVLVLCLS